MGHTLWPAKPNKRTSGYEVDECVINVIFKKKIPLRTPLDRKGRQLVVKYSWD
jgi:hypothetical protein